MWTVPAKKGLIKLSTGFPPVAVNSHNYPVTTCTCWRYLLRQTLLSCLGLKGVLGQELLNVSLKCHREESSAVYHPSSLGKSEITTFTAFMPIHNSLISGNSLAFGRTILILCLFVSIHGNMNKQRKTIVPGSVVPPLCHLPYKFYSPCSCLLLLLPCSLLRFKFYSALRSGLTAVPVTFWQSTTV